MKLANIDKTTGDIDGGTIVRNADGEPNGIFKDNATNLITSIIPPYSKETSRRALHAAMDYAVARGITQVHTMVTVDCACGFWRKNLGVDADKQGTRG